MRKFISLGLVLIMFTGLFNVVSYGSSVELEVKSTDIILISSFTLLKNAVAGDGMGEYDASDIDDYVEVMRIYTEMTKENATAEELAEAKNTLVAAFNMFKNSRNANQEELDRYNNFIDQALLLIDNATVGTRSGNLSQENYNAIKNYIDSSVKFTEGRIVRLSVVQSKTENLTDKVMTHFVFIEVDTVEEAVEKIIKEVVEEPIEVIDEKLPEPESIPISIVDLLDSKPIEQTKEEADALNEEMIILIRGAESITTISTNSEKSQQLFNEIIIPVGGYYNEIDQNALTSKQLLNESINLANITIALSGKVALDNESLIIEEDTVLISPTAEKLLEAVQKTEASEKAIESLLDQYLDEGLENAVVSTVNIAVPDTLKNISKTRITVSKETVEILKESTVERLNLDMGTVNFGINNKFLEKYNDTDFQFSVDKLAPLKIQDIAAFPEAVTLVETPIFDLGADQNEKRGDLFKHPVNLSFDLKAFKSELKENESFVIYRLNNTTNEWEAVSGFYNPITDTITVSRLHLSKYTVVKAQKNFVNIEDSWAKNEIAALKNNGVIKNTELFNPSDAISREEFASWITTAYGLDVHTLENEFSDIDKDSPYYEAVATAYEQGIIVGYPDGTFDPKGDITKEEMASMIASAMDTYEYGVDTDTFKLAQYEEDIPQWALGSVETVVENGLVAESFFGTADIVTKEEAASILYNVYR